MIRSKLKGEAMGVEEKGTKEAAAKSMMEALRKTSNP